MGDRYLATVPVAVYSGDYHGMAVLCWVGATTPIAVTMPVGIAAVVVDTSDVVVDNSGGDVSVSVDVERSASFPLCGPAFPIAVSVEKL
jgi:hypothetical protein